MSEANVMNYAKILSVTLGKQGAHIHANGEMFDIPTFPVPDHAIADPTGVGDAFRAGILRGMALNWPWSVSGRAASLCAAYTLENVGTQNHHYTPQEFVTRFRTCFDDNGVLDSLISSSQPVR